MPLQNRVTPYGEIIIDPARGMVMGNRGCLHDRGDRILRPYQVRRWIICRLDFKGRQQTLMPPGRWTALFFLDEATALAAGHRPCHECNRAKARAFAECWLATNPEADADERGVDRIDRQLHRERLSEAPRLRDRRKRTYQAALDALPDGAFVDLGNRPHLVLGDRLLPWRLQGYGVPATRPAGLVIAVLTPPSTVRALAHGYAPDLHPSATKEAAR
ncbi:MAG: hypothetical protein HGA45_21110 [Chloroflexales bacterium]|nr:hypothetical protein [Chloroflexales bacterium]